MGNLPKIIGERIRKYRKERGLSQEELAYMANLHTSYIGQLERGEKNATLESIEKVANALGITLEQLFRSIKTDSNSKDDTLTQIVTQLQARSIEDQTIFLQMLNLLLVWKDR
ncbi:putative transcription factor, MBF1 like protein [[Clostridium] ultunense Esp]|uniref:helix-turn-helix domain-containing protein n=1 Tax=Thermicanus aegyptius TaxID=94009 RepID=UPI0002B6FF94|nr:helix-turn-helix transcriptional regulator [Thermicanus aegyptius]CCQ98652.1 putative transcription factor, MBF1 like protein [[Clostridium] ultunense Esp]